jgi:hypothetical protein
MFEHAAVQELLGLCRQLLRAEGPDAAAVVDPAKHDAVSEDLLAACAEQGLTQQSGGTARMQSTVGSTDHAGGVDATPLPAAEGAATQGVCCTSKTAADGSCITPPSPYTGDELASAVCAMRGFDTQSFLRSVAALCLAAADSNSLSLTR